MRILVTTDTGREPTVGDARIQVLGLARVVESLRVEVADDPDVDFDTTLELRFDASRMRYSTRSVEVASRTSSDVNGVMLRRVRVQDYLRLGARAGIYIRLDPSEPPLSLADWIGYESDGFFSGPVADAWRTLGPTPATLDLVALSYVAAQVSAQPPAKAVERDFGLPARTAANWISRARAEGLLTSLTDESEGTDDG